MISQKNIKVVKIKTIKVIKIIKTITNFRNRLQRDVCLRYTYFESIERGLEMMNKRTFPAHFLFGAASAAYQVEGAYQEDQKGVSIWDVYAHLPGTTFEGTNGDVAVDHYHRYKEDIRLMAEQGLDSYRFSIAWTRIFPNGRGEVNQKGIQFYSDLVDELLKHNIIPFVTLYHWDLPQALQDEGGWESQQVIEDFVVFAKVMFEALGDRVKHWITFNEMVVFATHGYKTALHPPGVKDERRALNVSHHVFLAHAKTVLLYKSLVAAGSIIEGEIGITHVINPSYPASDAPGDIRAAEIAEGQNFYWFYDPVLLGEYPKETLEMYRQDNGFPGATAEETALLKEAAKLNDFIGINYYQSAMYAENTNNVGFQGMNTDGTKGSQTENGEPGRWKAVRNPNCEYTDWDWAIHPEGLADGMRRIQQRYGDITIYITENGLGAVDTILEDGSVIDDHRIDYVKKHLLACLDVLDEGIQLKGYYMWSFTDLLSWLNGYKKQYGFVYVDHQNNLERRKKKSYYWFQEVIETQGASLSE